MYNSKTEEENKTIEDKMKRERERVIKQYEIKATLK